MPFTIIRKETPIDDIANRVFKGLDAGSRKDAVAAILKANPRLKGAVKVPAGVVISVPDIPELETSGFADKDNPIAGVSALIEDQLDDYLEYLGDAIATRRKILDSQKELLKPKLNKAIEKSKTLKAIKADLVENQKQRRQAFTKLNKNLKSAFETLKMELPK